ncbi:MAG: hypothetical protein AABZ08_02200 [Planctomycetota bacterium]|mgnify:CR=1 FL=1
MQPAENYDRADANYTAETVAASFAGPTMSTQPDQPERRGIGGWILQHPKSTIALAILLIFALAILGLSRSAESRLAAKIAAIRAKGEPTTIQDLLARQRHLPDDKNRVVAVNRIASRFKSVTVSDERLKHLPYQGGAIQPRTGIRWPEKEIETAQWYLGQIEHDLADLHDAMKIKDSSFCIPWTSPAFNTFPDYSAIRAGAKVLVLDAEVAAMLGDRDLAERNLLDAFGMPRLTNGGESLITALTQMAINSLICDVGERIINQVGLRDTCLQSVEQSLHDADGSIDIKMSLFVERVQFLDSLHWFRANKASGAQFFGTTYFWQSSPVAFWPYLPALPALDIAEGLAFHTAMIDAVNGPNIESIRSITVVETTHGTMPWYSILSKTMIGGYSRVVALWVHNIGQLRALRVAVAAERYRLASGKWPNDAQSLVPQFIDAIPPDPIDRKPIRYAIIPEGIKTWTISGDADNRDNGGDVQRIEPGNNKHRPTDFGWVILNPDLRGREETPAVPSSRPTLPTTQPSRSTRLPSSEPPQN